MGRNDGPELRGFPMDIQEDYYATLGVSPTATQAEIKRAYRRLARQYHPDAPDSPQSTSLLFRLVQEAYEVLGDAKKRALYDQERRRAQAAEIPPLTLRATPSHITLPLLDEQQAFYFLLELFPSSDELGSRMPLNLCLVLDRSTSMQGARLQRVKEATNYIVDYLTEQDYFSLVTFSDRAEVVLPAQRGLDKAIAKSKVSMIHSSGGTEILQGLLAGLAQIERWQTLQTLNHLILLTDGQTYGDEEECLAQAIEAGECGISISTMGIGQDWNDKLLDEIASSSGGTSVYIDSASKITSVFRERIHGLSSIFARNLQLTLLADKNATIKDVFRISPYIDRFDLTQKPIELGHIERDSPLGILVELWVQTESVGKTHLLTAEVQGNIVSVGLSDAKVSVDVGVEVTTEKEDGRSVPPAIVGAMGKLSIFRMQEKTLTELERGDIERASQRLETMATRLLNIGETELAKAALLEAGRLVRTGRISPEGRKKIRYGTRSLSILPKEIKRD
jgi:Ca-activated chloride channel family protein